MIKDMKEVTEKTQEKKCSAHLLTGILARSFPRDSFKVSDNTLSGCLLFQRNGNAIIRIGY